MATQQTDSLGCSKHQMTTVRSNTDATSVADCRLCGGAVTKAFTLDILDKYPIDYSRCSNCLSLQTANPFWLEETYNGAMPNLDMGAARRALRTCAIVMIIAKALGIGRTARLLDFGGGDGLACRFLRDLGFDAFVYDKYAKNFYADGYSGDPNENYEIVCAIELLEHLAKPKEELDAIFSNRPRLVIVATEFYDGQGSDWHYLGPKQGGHVFFYSLQAIGLIAKELQYTLIARSGTAVFVRGSLPLWKRKLLAILLRPGLLLAGRIWMQTIRPRRREI